MTQPYMRCTKKPHGKEERRGKGDRMKRVSEGWDGASMTTEINCQIGERERGKRRGDGDVIKDELCEG